MARPTTARAEPTLLDTAPFVLGGVGVPVPVGPTGVLDPEGTVVVALLAGGGTPVPVPVLPVTIVVGGQ